MASTSRLTLYTSSLQQLSRRFSTQSSFKPASATFIDVTAENQNKGGATNLNFPLPGNTTTAENYFSWKNPFPSVATQGPAQTDVLTSKLYKQDQCDTVQQAGQMDAKENVIKPAKNELEFSALNCPKLVKKDFADLFPNRDVNDGSFTLMNLTQKTENDMVSWNEQMETERDELTIQFIQSASQICAALKDAGYWADFIDPTSGRPYLGPFTNATLFETDERMRNFGLAVEDLGCCKVIKHAVWGTHAFVGNLFTDAPLDSPVMQEIVSKMNQV